MAPLLNQDPFPIATEPQSMDQVPPGTNECWQIRFTQEIFLNYDDYLNRMLLYQRPLWTCSVTGKTGLTYEQALESEAKAEELAEAALNRFPVPLQKRILELVQFSLVPRLDQLVDTVFNAIKSHYVLDEPVLLSDGYRKYLDATVLEVLPDDQYRIQVKNRKSVEDIRIVLGSELSRQRYLLSKQNLKMYIRDVASHEVHGLSPWLIREDLAQKHNISKEMPEAVKKQLSQKQDEEDLKVKRKKLEKSGLPKPRWPIEDTEIPFYLSSDVYPEMATTSVPYPKKDVTVPKDCIPDLLFVWSFLFNYSQPLRLSPFSLDDFENALRFSKSDAKSPILMSVLLRLMTAAMTYFYALRARQLRAYRYIKNRPKPRNLVAASTTESTDAINDGSTQNGVDEPMDDVADGSNADVLDDETAVDDDHESRLNGEDRSKSVGDKAGANQSALDFLNKEEKWWKIRLNEDSVMEIAISCLFSVGSVFDVENLPNIMRLLTDNDDLIVDRDAGSFTYGHVLVKGGGKWRTMSVDDDLTYYDRFAALPIADKLSILRIIITECVVCSDEMRTYIDKAEDQSLEYRKEKRELDVQRKQKAEERQKLEEGDEKPDELKRETVEVDAVVDDNVEDDAFSGGDLSDAEDSILDEPDSPNSKAINRILEKLAAIDEDASRANRQEKMKLQQQLRDAEDKQRVDRVKRARDAAKEKNAELRLKAKERRELDAELDKMLKREVILDRELRLLSGCIRARPLGCDRFWNRYWWFDGYGSGISGMQEYNAYTGYSSRGSFLIPFGTGRLWVEGVGKPEFLGEVSGASGRQIGKRRKPGDDPKLDPLVTMPEGFEGRFGKDLIGDNWLQENEWAYYDNTEQLDELLSWLNPKGVREQLLKNTLQKYYDNVVFNLKKRQESIASLMTATDGVRVSTRQKAAPQYSEPHMQYVNRWE